MLVACSAAPVENCMSQRSVGLKDWKKSTTNAFLIYKQESVCLLEEDRKIPVTSCIVPSTFLKSTEHEF